MVLNAYCSCQFSEFEATIAGRGHGALSYTGRWAADALPPYAEDTGILRLAFLCRPLTGPVVASDLPVFPVLVSALSRSLLSLDKLCVVLLTLPRVMCCRVRVCNHKSICPPSVAKCSRFLHFHSLRNN